MEKKMIKQMMMALLLAMMPFAASAQEISIRKVPGLMRPAKLGKNKTLDTSVMECIYNYRIIDHSIGRYERVSCYIGNRRFYF